MKHKKNISGSDPYSFDVIREQDAWLNKAHKASKDETSLKTFSLGLFLIGFIFIGIFLMVRFFETIF